MCRAESIRAESEIRPTVLIGPDVWRMSGVVVEVTVRAEGCVNPFAAMIDRVRGVTAEQFSAPSSTSVAVPTLAEQGVVDILPRETADRERSPYPHHVSDLGA